MDTGRGFNAVYRYWSIIILLCECVMSLKQAVERNRCQLNYHSGSFPLRCCSNMCNRSCWRCQFPLGLDQVRSFESLSVSPTVLCVRIARQPCAKKDPNGKRIVKIGRVVVKPFPVKQERNLIQFILYKYIKVHEKPNKII